MLGVAIHEGTSFPGGNVDFITQIDGQNVPIEVKADENLQAKR